MLLPINLIKFQIPNDTPDSEAGIQQAAIESEAHDARENPGRHEQQAIDGRASPSLAAAEDLENKVIAANLERQEDDELDDIVAEVQETADLVIHCSLKKPS